MSSEVTADGITIQRLPEIIVDLQARERLEYGPQIEVEAEDPLGQLNGIMGEREASALELAEAVHAGGHFLSAAGVELDQVIALVGMTRREAIATLVDVVLDGTATTPIPTGSRAHIDGTSRVFETIADVVIGGGGTVAAVMRAVDTGPIQARALSTWVIDTPVLGWDGVTNATDGEVGRARETDARVRLRLVNSFTGQGNNLDSMLARLLTVPDVTEVRVFENKYAFTDADGRPPHSSEAIVVGGDDAAIAAAIWNSQPVGIRAYGVSVTTPITDTNGDAHEVQHTRPTALDVYITVNILARETFPEDGDEIVETAILQIEPDLRSGRNFHAWLVTDAIAAVVDPNSVESVEVLIGEAALPFSDETIAVGTRERVNLDSTQTVVNVTRV